MSIENPLEIPITCNNHSGSGSAVANISGRPKSGTTIKFSTQPKSLLITQLLSQTEDRKPIIDGAQIFQEHFENEPFPDQKLGSSDYEKHKSNSIINPREIQEYLKNTSENTNSIQKSAKRYSCDYNDCTYSCKLSSNLIKHRRCHTSDKPYICDKCPFRTNFVNSLKVHQRLHTADRPYECKQCPYKCNSSSNLKKHCRHKHNT